MSVCLEEYQNVLYLLTGAPKDDFGNLKNAGAVYVYRKLVIIDGTVFKN